MQLNIEMISGVAGDMLLASLLDLIPKNERTTTEKWLTNTLTALTPNEPVILKTKTVSPGGIQSLQIDFKTPEDDWQIDHHNQHTHTHIHKAEFSHSHDHHDHKSKSEHSHANDHHAHEHKYVHHRNFVTIKKIISATDFSSWVKEKSMSAFEVLAKAEGSVHGIPYEEVHFHEVGSLDAIYEVCSFFLLAECLGVTTFTASRIVVGTGTVCCAHGLMPVPVPAVLNMLKTYNVPYKKITWETGELTTPTGLAILLGAGAIFNTNMTHSSEIFHAGPTEGNIAAIGYGAGHKHIPGLVNCVRATLQEVLQNTLKKSLQSLTPKNLVHTHNGSNDFLTDTIVEIKTNIDDMTGEELAHLVDSVFNNGALDVVQYPVIMKKGRQGVVLEIITHPEQFERIAQLLLLESSTLGIRYQYKTRVILPRSETMIQHEGYNFKVKWAGGRYKVEDESLRMGLEQINSNFSLKRITRKDLLQILERKISDSKKQ